MKVFRAIQSVLKYYEAPKELMKSFDDFRCKHSIITEQKEIKSTLVLSIHPMDFMTASDNSLNWESCISWTQYGGGRTGTLELLNSNNVICAYLESNNDYIFKRNAIKEEEKEYSWSNKKWRQFFYIEKDIIMGGKAYPYENLDITETVLLILKDLAKENFNWTYTFGPEQYGDMKHVFNGNRMEHQKNWICSGDTYKTNIIFDGNAMYNDMMNDNTYYYLCIRNKPKRSKVISYSGKAYCICCGEPFKPFDSPLNGDYNERYVRDTLVCEECEPKKEKLLTS